MARKKELTEREWLECRHLDPALDFVWGRLSERKLRLFVCSCCRRVWDFLPHARTREAIEVGERYADGLADEQEREAALRDVKRAREETYRRWQAQKTAASTAEHGATCAAAVAPACLTDRPALPTGEDPRYLLGLAAKNAAYAVKEALRDSGPDLVALEREEWAVLCHRLRDLAGPLLFRRVVFDPAWLAWQGGAVGKLARAAYDERALPSGLLDNARLAILADALEEAGCTDREILEHCRGGGEHIRGCWVVDRVCPDIPVEVLP